MKSRRKVNFLFAVGGLVAVACVVGIALLAPIVFQKGYQRGGDPEAIAYNYLMALVRQDYARAYGYLSPALSQYPTTVEGFLDDLEEHSLLPAYELQPCVYVESVEMDGDRAAVELRVQYYDPCLRGGLDFRNLSFNQTRLELECVGEEWRVVDAEGGFFYEGWAHSGE